jgi:chromosome segregation ATPase
MAEQNAVVAINKRIERIDSFERLIGLMREDLKEWRYKAVQLEAENATHTKNILAKKEEIAKLEEEIRRKKIEVAGSFNNFRDDLTAREQKLTKSLAELKVREDQVKERTKAVEELMVKAEKVLPKSKAKEVASKS